MPAKTAQGNDMRTIIANATLIDCVQPIARERSSTVSEKGRITAISPDGRNPEQGDAQVMDVNGAYVMPGLWDVHIHPDYLSLAEMPLADQVALFGHRMMSALTESGIIGLRCAGT